MMTNDLINRFGTKLPIIQAPMASATTPDMVVAAAHAGALGSLGAAYMAPEEISSAIRDIRAQINVPFQVNLFSPSSEKTIADHDVSQASQRLTPIQANLGLANVNELPEVKNNFGEQLEVVLREKVPIVGFHFGFPEACFIEKVKSSGALIVGCATSPVDAVALETEGADAIVAQGFEAGGHQGTFNPEEKPSMLGLMALVPQVVDVVSVPVIAAGGMMDGRGIAAALKLGASAAQLGTAFLATPESKAHQKHKEILLSGNYISTRITRAFSGRPARGIINSMMNYLDDTPENILPFPYQHSLTSKIRLEAARQGKSEYFSMWAGQGASMARGQNTGEIIAALARELDLALAVD
ncbi:MAG: nitronate monooxygenase [Rhodospirillaceae bacterium]|nr:nitronate monooxygenase [Rhodospirillaceae bacterium]